MGYLIVGILSLTLGFASCVIVVIILVKLAENEAANRMDWPASCVQHQRRSSSSATKARK